MAKLRQQYLTWVFFSLYSIQICYCDSGTLQTHPKELDGGSVSTLREHYGSGAQCSEWPFNALETHKVEKRSYLPPVTCSTPHEMGALKSKIHCQPRPRVVKLPWPNDTSIHQMTPSHVEVNRCDGGCFHHSQSCLPSKIQKKIVPVLLAQCSIHSDKCDKICAQLEIEEHTECQCECKVKQHHCNSKQVYRDELCNCQCRDISEIQACHNSGRVWDPGMCLCRCHLSSLQHCSTNYVFDFTNSCKCIPEESNEIPGDRAERSHEAAFPNWEILTIGAMVLTIFILVVVAISLARYVQRLKNRLRMSAEVLVTTGPASPLMTQRPILRRDT